MLTDRPSRLLEILADSSAFIVDVGCSGGLHPFWRQFGSRLGAVGFDPLSDEIARLRRTESTSRCRYEDAWVIAPLRQTDDAPSNYMLHRTSAYLGAAIHANRNLGGDFREAWQSVTSGAMASPPREAAANNSGDPFFDFYKERFSPTGQALSNRRATLDELLEGGDTAPIDLLKIDTDGWELDVLLGATRTLARTIAVEVEVQFHGPRSENANVFCNIDRELRAKGFTLMRLDAQTYGRSALPRKFVYPTLPAQTHGGPIQWADALYCRDLVTETAADIVAPERLRTAAIVYEGYNLHDVAAELILSRPQAFARDADVALDALARGAGWDSYSDCVRHFMEGVGSYRRTRE